MAAALIATGPDEWVAILAKRLEAIPVAARAAAPKSSSTGLRHVA